MKSMKRKGISLTRATSKIEGEAAVRINLAFIGSAKTHRSIAKIALTGLALKVGDKFALSDTFAPLREFVRTGLGPTPVRLFVSQEVLNRFRINVRYHALIFAFDAHKHRAYSVVVIFGGLFYLVRFTDAYNGVDFSWTYTYNSQAGKHPTMLFGATMISELGMVEKVLAGPTVWNNRKLSAECLMEYVRQVRPDVRI
ncbi:MAG: hypothetical protein A3G20_01835 [Acidobacteria bacterium RIFCSPLOWO2_12_FULL_59_11]|nr:MAG: hypothetical protein A3G20_01835 [Acidobacteria bacterium RIFCSPLOWO2_12_FULL_59_11]